MASARGAGAAAEVQHAVRRHPRDFGRGGVEHRLVAGDEAPDRLVVGVDLDAEVPADGVAAHGVEYSDRVPGQTAARHRLGACWLSRREAFGLGMGVQARTLLGDD